MKTLVIFIGMMLLSVASYSQTYKSPYVIKSKTDFETEMKDRVITVTDKEISISKFTEGTKTIYLTVNKIENKEWGFEGLRKTYYCTTKDKDPINGYQKAIVYKTSTNVVMALFADEITIFKYEFAIN